MRIVLDTSVLVAAFRSSRGASHAVLEEIEQGQIQILASPALFLEYEEVLKRSKHGLPCQAVDGILAELAERIEPVQIWYLWRPQLIDADDEMVLDAAINGRADAIVTHNGRDFELAAPLFGINVWSPATLLRFLRQKREG